MPHQVVEGRHGSEVLSKPAALGEREQKGSALSRQRAEDGVEGRVAHAAHALAALASVLQAPSQT